MSNDSVISKINRHIQRLLIEYKKQDVTLFNVLKELKSDDIKIKTHQEAEEGLNHVEIYHAHKLVFLLPKECFENGISISNQEAVSKKIKQDLNQIISESNEYIEEVKFELKDEIDINTYLKNKIMSIETPGFWNKDCLRVFISHSVKDYSFAKKLKEQLMNSDISCFVAHKDIEPTKKWQREIIKALSSMELVLALITEDFNESWWTNQEVGFALGRDIPIISIKLAQAPPPGFIYETQAITLNEIDIGPHSTGYLNLLKLIKKKFPEHFKKNLLNKFLDAKDGTFALAKEKFMDIINLEFSDQEIEKIVKTIKGPAETSVNQLTILLYDRISPKHLKQLPNSKYRYYAELLNDKVLSQHTQNRYSIKKSNRKKTFVEFEIVDSQATIAITNKQKIEELPF